jgi:hypothetical protein
MRNLLQMEQKNRARSELNSSVQFALPVPFAIAFDQ